MIRIVWAFYCQQLLVINHIVIPRYVILYNSDPSDIQIHGFYDASQAAYGACSIPTPWTMKEQSTFDY